ncbi:MAG: sigma-70 family RNA polymerase sigma factor [Planctomycetota bacterium]
MSIAADQSTNRPVDATLDEVRVQSTHMLSRRFADRAFARFQRTGSPRALARVFRHTAAELLRLARHLASSEAAAEDLVQATFVTAIEAAPTHRQETPVLPWLVGILGNHARVARRRARRTVDAARLELPGAVDPVAEVVRRELSATVHEALEHLPEPYRPVLRLYLEHGLEPSEIARTLERPPGTVRAQVSRGLDLLRAALPAARGAAVALGAAPGRGLAAVRAAVLARCPLAPAGAGALSHGVSFVASSKFSLAAAAVVVASLSGWYLLEQHGDPRAVVAAGVPTDRDASTAMGTTTVPAVRPVRTAIDAPTPTTDTVDAERPARTGVRVRVLRRATPVAGVSVRLRDHDDLRLVLASDPVGTDADGVAFLPVAAPGPYWVSVEAAGLRQLVQVSDAKIAHVTLTMPNGVTVEGVVRGPTGQPIAAAEVLAHANNGLFPDIVATSDAAGCYRAVDLAPGVWLQAWARGAVSLQAHAVNGRPGTTLTLDLAVGARGRRIVGRVWHADGSAAGSVRVACVLTTPPRSERGPLFYPALFTRTDGDGRFAFEDAETEGVSVVALPTGAGAEVAQAVVVAAGRGDEAVDVRLRPGATLRGKVLGRRLGGIRVQALNAAPATPMGYLTNILGLRWAQAAADGSFRLDGLIAGHYELSVQRTQVLARQAMDIDAGGDHEWNPHIGEANMRLTIDPPRPPDGAGRAWFVRLYRRATGGDLELVESAVASLDGSATFAASDPAARYEVVVALSPGGLDDIVVAHVADVAPGAQPSRVRIADGQLPSAHLRGRLVTPEGSPVGNRTVSAHMRVGDVLSSRASTLTDDSGGFDLGPLPPGTWSVFFESEGATRWIGGFSVQANGSADAGEVIAR